MLKDLSQIQRYDLDIDALDKDRQHTPPELIDMRRHKESLRDTLESVEADYNEARREVDANELEIKTLDERRKAAADAATAAQSGKEAMQYQNQELQFATRLQELEEDTMPMIERLDRLEQRVNELKEELAELEPNLQALVDAEQQRVEAIDKKIAALEAERETLTGDVAKPLLQQYEQIRRAKRGLALVEVVGDERCGGCNMKLPIHVLQKAQRSKGTQVTRCPSCGRILWYKKGA